MRLECFLLIDRIADLNLDERTIRIDATVPETSTIFEGHFPGYPLMPGVLLIEAMNQASGWLIIALTKFTRMPFFAAVKEAKLRSFVTPGQKLSVSAPRRQGRVQRGADLPAGRVSEPRLPRQHGEVRRRNRLSDAGAP